MATFTTIAFAMCAYLSSGFGSQTMILVGNIENGICNPFIFFPDSHGQTAVFNGHEYGVSVVDNGATLYFDGKLFFFVKDSI